MKVDLWEHSTNGYLGYCSFDGMFTRSMQLTLKFRSLKESDRENRIIIVVPQTVFFQ